MDGINSKNKNKTKENKKQKVVVTRKLHNGIVLV